MDTLLGRFTIIIAVVSAAGCGDDGGGAADATVGAIDSGAAVDAVPPDPDAAPPDAGTPDAIAYDATPMAIYFDDFEADDGGYTHSGANDEWAYGSPTGAPIVSCNSGTSCWGTDLAGDYNPNSDQQLESPVINVPDVPGTIKLEFAHSYEIEGTFYDWVTFAISINAQAYEPQFTYTGSTTHQDWETLEIDVSAAKGGTLQVRWGLGSDGSEQYDGYFIDDVRVFAE
jgi:hypothetical protein